ncbi:uncharacterized protein LOC116245505 [Nymphaea colorata]|uniref:uncharacterized protein LOC116245505 n=1 Tax=Nymphaea colorata TaxID=210225 RepID=UPI00129EA795|nr:uncharacterized protein LOC116245505 [Nymphaea colorata]
MSEAAYQPYAIIFVTEPVLQQGPNEKVPPYVTYQVSGQDPHGQFNIRRRFREFLLLRNKLVERFTGMYIPPIPSKRTAAITYDIREARALLEAIESRRAFESKKSNFEAVRRESKEELERLKSGRLSIKSFFTSGTKELQIKELENYIPHHPPGHPRFKKSRSIDYLATVQMIAQKEMRVLQLYGESLLTAQVKRPAKSVLVSHQQAVEVEKQPSKEEKEE